VCCAQQVVEVSEDQGRAKVACSIKLADQKTGADLDPAGAKWQPRGEGGGGGGGGYSRAPMQADVKVAQGVCVPYIPLARFRSAWPGVV
jgi:hypothetical protein